MKCVVVVIIVVVTLFFTYSLSFYGSIMLLHVRLALALDHSRKRSERDDGIACRTCIQEGMLSCDYVKK